MGSDVPSVTEGEDSDFQGLTSNDEFLGEIKVKSQKIRHACSYAGCNIFFSRPSRLIQHQRIHTGERPFGCKVEGCEKTYTRSSHLRRHIKNSHEVKKVKSKNDDESSDDEESSQKQKLAKCDECPKTFLSKYSLKKHQIIAHGKEGKRYPCSTCGTTFSKKSWLKHHITQHTGELPHKCPKCSKTFKYPRKLRIHMAVHNHKCNSCDLQFDTFLDYRKHKATHNKTVEKRTCPVCQAKFSNRSRLRQHYVIHNELRETYTCSYPSCLRTFYFEKNLSQHIKVHHEGNGVTCDRENCSAKLFSRSAMIRHKKAIHSDVKKEVKVRKPQKSTKKHPKKPIAALLTGAFLPRDVEKEIILKNKTHPLIIEDLQKEFLEKEEIVSDYRVERISRTIEKA